MTKTYKGNTPELYELFLKGEQLQYQQFGEGEWQDIPKYKGKPEDIYRVCGSFHNFRVKPKDDIIKMYMHYSIFENKVIKGDFNYKTCNLMMFDNSKGLSEHLEFTFVSGKLTKVEMKGPTE